MIYSKIEILNIYDKLPEVGDVHRLVMLHKQTGVNMDCLVQIISERQDNDNVPSDPRGVV